jgi:hypothetical protein
MLNKLQLKILKKLRELKEEENPTYFYGSMLFPYFKKYSGDRIQLEIKGLYKSGHLEEIPCNIGDTAFRFTSLGFNYPELSRKDMINKVIWSIVVPIIVAIITAIITSLITVYLTK